MRCKTVRLEPPPPPKKKTQCAIYGDLPTADGGTIKRRTRDFLNTGRLCPDWRRGWRQAMPFWIIFFFMCVIQLWFICRPSDSTVSEDVGIEPTGLLRLWH
jgi:hypothetical protein